jgi:peptidoglycan hydrolase-like protein with peptidoglycan-binding domain
MHSVDALTRRADGRPGRKAKDSGRTMSPDPIIADARVWIVVIIVVFLLSFAAARWLPDLMTGSPDNVSKPTAGTSTPTSEVTTTSLEQSDNSRSVTANPLIPIVIRRSTSANAEVSDLPPQTEISSPLVTVPEPVNTVATPQQLDLREIENAKRIQQRLIDLGFLFGAADGVWGQRSRRALQEFRAANGIGESDTWDEATQERLLRAPDAGAANTSDISFIGGWGIDVAECRESPITITARRAEAFGTACEFHSTQRESSNVWRLRAECASKTERWNANIRFTVSTSKLTWSSERGTTTYVRCPMASASR